MRLIVRITPDHDTSEFRSGICVASPLAIPYGYKRYYVVVCEANCDGNAG